MNRNTIITTKYTAFTEGAAKIIGEFSISRALRGETANKLAALAGQVGEAIYSEDLEQNQAAAKVAEYVHEKAAKMIAHKLGLYSTYYQLLWKDAEG